MTYLPQCPNSSNTGPGPVSLSIEWMNKTLLSAYLIKNLSGCWLVQSLVYWYIWVSAIKTRLKTWNHRETPNIFWSLWVRDIIQSLKCWIWWLWFDEVSATLNVITFYHNIRLLDVGANNIIIKLKIYILNSKSLFHFRSTVLVLRATQYHHTAWLHFKSPPFLVKNTQKTGYYR